MIFMRHSLLFQHFEILTQAAMIWHHLWMNLLLRQQFNRKSLYQKMCSVSLLIFTTPNLIWIWMNFDSDACDRIFRRFWLMWCDKELIIATLNVWYILFENGINEYWGMDLVWNLIRKGNQNSLSSFSFRENQFRSRNASENTVIKSNIKVDFVCANSSWKSKGLPYSTLKQMLSLLGVTKPFARSRNSDENIYF